MAPQAPHAPRPGEAGALRERGRIVPSGEMAPDFDMASERTERVVGVRIEALSAAAARAAAPALIAILQDAVDSGASVGFLPPLAAVTAAAYWGGVFAALDEGARVLLAARGAGGTIGGTAQLDPSGEENGRHRAEVLKVLVLRAARRQGVGRALMLALETHARRLGRTTLVLDTREGDPSERLYASTGWTRIGVVPRYCESAGGRLDGSAFYYKLLPGAAAPTDAASR